MPRGEHRRGCFDSPYCHETLAKSAETPSVLCTRVRLYSHCCLLIYLDTTPTVSEKTGTRVYIHVGREREQERSTTPGPPDKTITCLCRHSNCCISDPVPYWHHENEKSVRRKRKPWRLSVPSVRPWNRRPSSLTTSGLNRRGNRSSHSALQSPT